LRSLTLVLITKSQSIILYIRPSHFGNRIFSRDTGAWTQPPVRSQTNRRPAESPASAASPSDTAHAGTAEGRSRQLAPPHHPPMAAPAPPLCAGRAQPAEGRQIPPRSLRYQRGISDTSPVSRIPARYLGDCADLPAEPGGFRRHHSPHTTAQRCAGHAGRAGHAGHGDTSRRAAPAHRTGSGAMSARGRGVADRRRRCCARGIPCVPAVLRPVL
jgi:hypothetical protein